MALVTLDPTNSTLAWGPHRCQDGGDSFLGEGLNCARWIRFDGHASTVWTASGLPSGIVRSSPPRTGPTSCMPTSTHFRSREPRLFAYPGMGSLKWWVSAKLLDTPTFP